MARKEEELASQAAGSNWRWFWRGLVVLSPAVIAGLFTISPKLYDEITRPRAVLSYSEVSGPAIGGNNSFRRISSVRIENTGKVPLTGVALEITSAAGQIESSAADESPGIRPSIQSTATSYQLLVQRLLPTETLSASIMTSSSTPQPVLKLSVRSNEVLGTLRSNSLDVVPKQSLDFLLAFLTSAAVALTTIVMILLVRRGRAFSAFVGSGIRRHKADLVTFICAMSEAIPLSDDLLFREHEVSYLRAGDLLLFFGLRGDDATRRKCILALRALLGAVAHMADGSAAVIRSNLATLGAKVSDAEYEELRAGAKNSDDIIQARQRVLEIFAAADLPTLSTAK